MPKLSVIFHTLFARFLLLLVLILGSPIILLLILLPAKYRYKSRIVFRSLQLFYWSVLRSSFVPISFEGWENIPDEPVVFAANHSSSVDIPIVGVLARGKPHVWLAKEDLMQWKLLKWVLPRLAVIVDVNSREKAMRSMINLVRLVKGKNIDVMIFPEGTRYPDDNVHKFYGGFVTLAKLLDRPVVPVYISGANRVYPPDSFWVFYHPMRIVIGKPSKIQEGETEEAFKDRIHGWFLKQ